MINKQKIRKLEELIRIFKERRKPLSFSEKLKKLESDPEFLELFNEIEKEEK